MALLFGLSTELIHELMFLVGGIIIGMTIMVIIFDRYERRLIDQHTTEVDGLVGRIQELTRERAQKSRRTSGPSQERPSA